MNTFIKISVITISLSCIFSCKTQQFETPEYGKNDTEKIIKVEKVYNFRTVGNIKNKEGRTLKPGFFYRSGHLYKLRKGSFDQLEDLKIKEVIDLRNSKEIAQKPDHLPKEITYKNYSAFEDEGDQLDQAKKLVLKGKVKGTDADKRMISFYQEYVTGNPEVVKKIITETLDSETPVLYHCTAGKDRTGIITALILTILKFDKETIYNEYLLSNNYREDLVLKRLRLANTLHFLYPKMDIQVLEKLSWVEKRYLDATFGEISKKYGSADAYIQQALGISESKRKEYIEKFTY
ncbi:protein-tyrosine-phosphatase [Chryseobacterium indologenes]|uniref:tyrosine-protein phosphatase n=1 Tax=Chryseobacterium TaxID=59732 RepID=UPI00047F7871|nr:MULTISPECIES: tyrosine-protein phosphatase [Chryseobacterium]ATN06229.1 protein-tyrosine-phosphatase [Chryseobacterium indologenes]AYY85010.1 tyrosine-protein phosphatase [Chryseobacterium indologenes]QIX81892.1 tyrosine-protein phosphatase [Chryseobacterium indologenes]UDQ55665.1 tyrosine-protein phosphatase [Chryseobacterium indologenes]HAO29196.1 protein-tyrosine-phosphatase [Chryseobacterium indologenes]